MEENLDIGESSSSYNEMPLLDIEIDAPTSSYREARKRSIQGCIQSLVHACECTNSNCLYLPCQKMKRVVTHTKICRRKTKGDCPICKQLIAICCYHGKHCQKTKCLVPFCSSIKQKMKFLSVEADNKTWSQFLSVGLRDYYAHKLAVNLSPSFIHGSKQDGAVVQDAKKIEQDLFQKSRSKREYYHLIADKINNIQKTSEVNME